MTAVEEFAPAKINLTLHVTGRRADGYHLLDSLVAFASTGDRIRVQRASATSLRVTGPRAADVPGGPENLVLRAAAHIGVHAAITLEKNLPSAAGIGGGSSDAAACLRALAALAGREVPEDVVSLGADVPVCLLARAARMRGIGEDVACVGNFPVLDAVLINPGVSVATPEVFARLEQRASAAMPASLPDGSDAAAWVRWLADQRNDLESPAAALCPEIGAVMARLRESSGCALARMSGSGATCFGLYPTPQEAEAAAAGIALEHPGWWVTATRLS